MQVPSVWNLQIPTLSLVVGTSWVLAIDQAGVVCRSLFSWCFTLDCLVSAIHFNEYSVKKSNLSKNSLILCGLISEIYTLFNSNDYLSPLSNPNNAGPFMESPQS